MLKNYRMKLFTEHTPPNLERLFGYQSSKRWVAFFWGKIVDGHASGYCFDGRIFNTLNALAWDTFFSHPLMVAMNHRRILGHAVKRFDFGDAIHTSRHCLLLDRRQRILHAAKKSRTLEQLKMEARSSKRVQPHPDPRCPPTFKKPNGWDSPASTCSLRMIAEMTAWLDNRLALLEKTDQWPKLK